MPWRAASAGILFSLLACTAIAHAQQDAGNTQEHTLEAQIIRVDRVTCGDDRHPCSLLHLKGITPPFAGKDITTTLDSQDTVGGRLADIGVGDSLVLDAQLIGGTEHYAVTDLVRRPGLQWLTVLFCLAIILVGGWKATRSLLGMVVSFLILFLFILPRILAGDSPLFIALVGSFFIMGLTFVISHGWNAKMWSAFGGTCLSLLLTGALAWFFTVLTRLWGLADEDTVYLLNSFPHLNTRGLLLAGIVIGTLGSLNDVTISQASAVFELKLANPALRARQLYDSALRIGRDHISGAINTLVLAYAGASLPLLLLLTSNANQEPWAILLNHETFATEIVRTLVGSIGLLAAIPFTNIFASVLADRLPMREIRKSCGHSHSH